MASKLGDLCFPAGKYIKDGAEKTRWIKCGVLLQTDKGMRVKLDCIPVVTDPNGLWLSVFSERNDQHQQGSTAPAASQSAPAGEPDTPF